MTISAMRKAYDERRSAVEKLKALDADAGDKEFNEEQRAQVEAINADIDALDSKIQRLMRNEELEARSAELDGLIGEQRDAGIVDEETGLTGVELEARALFLSPDSEEFQRSVQFQADAVESARLARRDLLAGTATDGAELVPTTLFGQLYVTLREGATSMFSLGRSVITESGEQMDFPRNTSFSSAVRLAEAASLTESDPQFDTMSLNAYKYGLAIQVSTELGEDNAVPGALPWVIEQAVDAIRRGVGGELLTADGSSKPNGVLNGTTTTTVDGVTYPTADKLIETMYDITGPYRANGVWLMNDDTVKGIRLLKDNDGQYIWQPGLQAGKPDILLGRSVYTDSGIATVGANAKIGAFGDFQRGYLVRTVNSIRAERSDDYAFLNDLTTWRFLGRFDGDIIDNSAFTVMTNEAS